MQYTAIAKDGGLFIPNLHQFLPNEILTIDVLGINRSQIATDDDDDENFDDLIGIWKGVDGVEFQNALREE